MKGIVYRLFNLTPLKSHCRGKDFEAKLEKIGVCA